ncbi:collagen alpha-2(I) chain-like, partial [Malurus melanocephalus]|uniref:collagen alpha-2(I) chain-like n=1 Tax=Malurus melanocephalus TaxID=175006 RepID=UPI0025494861
RGSGTGSASRLPSWEPARHPAFLPGDRDGLGIPAAFLGTGSASRLPSWERARHPAFLPGNGLGIPPSFPGTGTGSAYPAFPRTRTLRGSQPCTASLERGPSGDPGPTPPLRNTDGSSGISALHRPSGTRTLEGSQPCIASPGPTDPQGSGSILPLWNRDPEGILAPRTLRGSSSTPPLQNMDPQGSGPTPPLWHTDLRAIRPCTASPEQGP